MSMKRIRALAVLGPPALFLLVLAFVLYRPGVFLRAASRNAPQALVLTSEGGTPRSPNSAPVDGATSSDPSREEGEDPASSTTPTAGIVRVTGHDGRALRARVRVAISRDGFRTFETREAETDENGRLALELDPKDWVALSVHADGYAAGWMPPLAWGELDARDLSFSLEDGRQILGALSSNSGVSLAQVRMRFSPAWPTNEYSGIVASRLGIIDGEIVTDANGGFSCASLRTGAYRVSFPDHPTWPALTVRAEDMAAGRVPLRVPWERP